MKKEQFNTHIDKYAKIYKPTNDDWHGNFEDNTVALEYIGELSDGTYRVLVTGNDDTGYEKDFESEQEAIDTYNLLSGYFMINYADVKHLGFKHK